MIKPPAFWYRPHSCFFPWLLSPLAALYCGITAGREWFNPPKKASIPVICVGNLVMGGAGKTPTTQALIPLLRDLQETPHILSRGYKAQQHGEKPLAVDPLAHLYNQVGDEALLLSRDAPTWICRNRLCATLAAADAGASLGVLDDGYQNPSLYKDIHILVVDAQQGIGNGWVFPSGPLREPFTWGLKRADAIVMIGAATHKRSPLFSDLKIPLFEAQLIPQGDFKPGPVVAFAGIGYPKKFQQTLKNLGYDVRQFLSFPDHHAYTRTEIAYLERLAQHHQATLLTTAKDAARVPYAQIPILPIQLKFEQPDQLKEFLHQKLKESRLRKRI